MSVEEITTAADASRGERRMVDTVSGTEWVFPANGQPLGLTWGDVDRLRYVAVTERKALDKLLHMTHTKGLKGKPAAEFMESLADRIALLLPPRDVA